MTDDQIVDAELASLRAKLEQAEKALEPFVACKREMDSDDENSHGGIMAITVRALSDKNLQAAQSALAAIREKDKMK